MSKYKVYLSKEKERFLDFYLTFRPLRLEHQRKDYPSIVVNNWLNSLMKIQNQLLADYHQITGEEWKPQKKPNFFIQLWKNIFQKNIKEK